MKTKLFFIIVLLCAVAGTATTARAESKTVTYTITSEPVSGYTNRYTLTFVRNGNSFGYSNGQKTVTIPDITTSTGFHVELDDGLGLQLNLSQAGLTFGTYDGRTGIQVNYGGSQNDNLTLGSSHYYVTHVKMADLSGNALTGTANPWIRTSGLLDKDVDMVTLNDALGAYNAFSATFSGAQIFGQLTVTYGDTPREYAITFNDVEDLSNPNPASYNVTTSAFLITAPSRTGYTLGTVTYTDALHTTATPVNLSQTPMTINRGDAVERKAITFEASWTANTYTLRLNHNDGTSDYTDQTLTYDQAANIQSVPRTGYVFTGWNTQADGSGTSYNDGQSVTNLTAEQGAVIDLYAQWANPSGSCGDNATWEYDHANTTLTISGSGEVTAGYSTCPWADYKTYITTLDIGSDITSISHSLFNGHSALTTITGGEGLIYVDNNVFLGTPWLDAAKSSASVVYLGHVAYIGYGVSGDLTIQNGTVSIAGAALKSNTALTSVTIPANVASIGSVAFIDCTVLTTVNILADTPPTLGSKAFYLIDNRSLARTFNVRSAAYKTADGWADIYNKENAYSGHSGFQMRVVSTLDLPDGVTASAADAADKVTAYDTDYFAEQASVTLTGLGTEHTAGGITYRSRATVSYGNGQTLTADADATGQASFTMPAADATVTAEDFPYAVKYIDATGTERSKPYADITFIQSGSKQTLGSSANDEAWYAVSGEVSAGGTLTINDKSVHLILCDGASLSATSNNDYGMDCPFGALTIYVQSGGTGTLNAKTNGSSSHGINTVGNLTINGGTVSATSVSQYAIYAYPGDITINGGTVTATSGEGSFSNGIRANRHNNVGGKVTINGGTVTATGGRIGIYGDGNVTINGGSVSATGSSNSGIIASIGGSVTINGGTVTATGGSTGIYAGSTITLGWTSATDRITASSYSNPVSVKSGQTLYDGTTAYSGTVTASDIAGKTLEPGISFILPNGTTILLDDDSAQPAGYKNADRIAALADDGTTYNIMLYGRTLYRDGDWNTLYLPFDIDVNDIHINSSNPLCEATIMALDCNDWYDAEGNVYYSYADGLHRSGEVKNGNLHLYFREQGTIAACVPYIVKWGTKDSHPTTDIVNPVFQNVVIELHSFAPTTDEGPGNVTFRGTFAPKDYAAANHSILFLGAANSLYYPEAGAHIGPFRAYFELGNGLTVGDPASPVRAFSLSFGEGSEETGIVSVSKESGNQGTIPEFLNSLDYYTLDGVRLNGKPTKKGLYIHGGKKAVVK